MSELKRIDVAAAVPYRDNQVLLVRNPNWDAFTFPMTKLHQRPLGLRGADQQREPGTVAAARAVCETLGRTITREPGLLMDVGDVQQSDRTGEINHYHFQVFGFPMSHDAPAPAATCEWLTPDEILDPDRHAVSATVRRLVRNLMEATLDRGRSFPPAIGGPLRTSTGSLAVIHRPDNEQNQWLVQWNDNWQRYFLIGGHLEPADGGDPACCLIRELEEELKLTIDRDRLEPLQLDPFTAWSGSAWRYSEYALSAFALTLYPQEERLVDNDGADRWLTAAEIRSERCEDGKLVSPSVRRILAKLGEL